MVGVETNSSQAYAPACPLKNKVILMKKAVFAILLSTAAIVAGPVACSKGDEAEKTEATYTAGTELGISKAAMDTCVTHGVAFSDRQSVVSGKSVSVRVTLGGSLIIKNNLSLLY